METNFSTAYHPQTDGQSKRTIQILEDLIPLCVMDFGGPWEEHLPLVEFAYNNSYQASIGMAPFEALYGRPCRSLSCWLEGGEPLIVGPELLQDSQRTVELIRQRLLAAQDRQRSYADQRRRDISFAPEDHVFLKVSPTKGGVRFGRRGKLSPRYIGPFEVLRRVGEVAYELALPPSLSAVHPVFHVSMLKKYVPDGSHQLQHEKLDIRPDLSYEEEATRILDRSMKTLRRKEVPSVKVLWSQQGVEEATWEREEEMRQRFPRLFPLEDDNSKY